MDLTKEIESLPLPLRKELEDFLIFLKFKAKHQNVVSNSESKEKDAKWEFGMWKDKIKVADDFDESLSDFNDYM